MDLKLLPFLVTLGGNPLQDGGGFVCRRGMMGVDECVGIGDIEIHKIRSWHPSALLSPLCTSNPYNPET